MYIDKLTITNFRGFSNESTIKFNEDINVLIGSNNSGKTTILKALSILFSKESNKKLNVNDFNRNISIDELLKSPPQITISATLTESDDDDAYSDDLLTVFSWLTRIEKPFKAQITYTYYLPEKEHLIYEESMKNLSSNDINTYWKEIETSFIRKYKYNILIGDPKNHTSIDYESLDKFDFQFLDAVRDTERDLYSGSNTLLREIIDFYMDYDIKISKELDKDEKIKKIRDNKNNFSKNADYLIDNLKVRMKSGKGEILKYVNDLGANFENQLPDIDGKISDTEMYSALRLIVKNETGIQLPVSQNGLGYNNLLYISLLLAKIQKNASGEYMGSNAKVFPILAIEEPEAHLHPNLQYKFLSFLNENSKTQVRQIFITTHSPNITAAVNLDSIIVLNKKDDNIISSYPGKVFSDSADDQASKRYVERFLDVTKSDILFSNSIIFVEGITEQLLIPEFAKYLDVDLIDYQISTINLNGRYFTHFLKLFDTTKSDNAIPKRVVCITDKDPERISLNVEKAAWKACYPFEIDIDPDRFSYKQSSNPIHHLKKTSNDDDLIQVFMQEYGSTFEYQLLLDNPNLTKLISPSMRNQEELKKLMSLYSEDMTKDTLDKIYNLIREGDFKKRIKHYISKSTDQETTKAKNIIAARYLESIKKGEVAQELTATISQIGQDKNAIKLVVPDYIKEAITWISKTQ